MTAIFALQDLANYMQTNVTADTGALILQLVTGLIAEEGLDYSDPAAVVPVSVKTVALTASARAYSNPQNNRGETVGPYSVQRDASLGIYLTDAERATLASVIASGQTTAVTLGVGSISLGAGLPGYEPFPTLRRPWPGTLGNPER